MRTKAFKQEKMTENNRSLEIHTERLCRRLVGDRLRGGVMRFGCLWSKRKNQNRERERSSIRQVANVHRGLSHR